MYTQLMQPEFNDRTAGFYTEDLKEDMSLVHESIYGWWKPRFLIDHRSKEAFEFMDVNECFTNFSQQDVDWNSLKELPGEYVSRARRGYAGFPTHIYYFKGGVATVEWQINPDGRYYMDEDGFGMTDDEEVALFGAIDRKGNVVKKYKLR